MTRQERQSRYMAKRQQIAHETIQPYVRELTNIYSMSTGTIVMFNNGTIKHEPNLSDEAKACVENLNALIEHEMDKLRVDVLTFGQGFSKQTSFPLCVENVPYKDICMVNNIA